MLYIKHTLSCACPPSWSGPACSSSFINLQLRNWCVVLTESQNVLYTLVCVGIYPEWWSSPLASQRLAPKQQMKLSASQLCRSCTVMLQHPLGGRFPWEGSSNAEELLPFKTNTSQHYSKQHLKQILAHSWAMPL